MHCKAYSVQVQTEDESDVSHKHEKSMCFVMFIALVLAWLKCRNWYQVSPGIKSNFGSLNPGGYLDLVWMESAARALKPLSIFKDHFHRKRYQFLRIFLEIQAHFPKFLGVRHANIRKFWIFLKNEAIFKDIFVENGTHVQGFLVKKRPIRDAHPYMS